MKFVRRRKTGPPTTRLTFTSRSGEEASLAIDVRFTPRPPEAAALFMPGHGSVRDGDKARALADAFAARGVAWVAFDPRGHGASSGTMDGLTLDRHLEDLDAAYALARTIAPRVIGVGASLGALSVATYAARRPRAFTALVLVAPAFGFFQRWRRVPKAMRPPELTDAALRSSRIADTRLVAPRLRVPALVWHGMRDETVPWQESARFASLAKAPVEVRLLSRGDHRLTPFRLRIAAESCEWLGVAAGR